MWIRKQARICALWAALAACLWSRSALADVTVTVSPALQQALKEGHPEPSDPPPTADQLTRAVNQTLREIADEPRRPDEDPGRQELRDIARRLLDSGQTIRLICREDAEGDPTLAEAHEQSDPAQRGGGAATKGDFDADGNPRRGGTATIVVECAHVKTHGLSRPYGIDDGTVLGKIGHELVHASQGRYRHSEDDDPSGGVYRRFEERVMEVFGGKLEQIQRDDRIEERRRRRQTGQTGMGDAPQSGAYVALQPGLIHIPCNSSDRVGYQWGAQGGYMVRTPGLFAVGVGGSFEHAVLNPPAAVEGVSSHQLRVQAEAMPGVQLVARKLFVHGTVALGYVGWPTRFTSGGVTTRAADHGVALGVGAGANYRVWQGLFVGGQFGGDLQWIPGGVAVFPAYNLDLEASVGWFF